MPGHPLEPVARLDGVPEAVTAARSACEELRWHGALRRRWEEVRVESGVRAVRAGLLADGVPLPLDLVRDVARGLDRSPSGAAGDALSGALRVQAEVERLMPAPGSAGAQPPPPGQLLARWHLAAVGDVPGAGRPRTTEPPGDLRGLGPAPTGPEAAARLGALTALLAIPLPAGVPALVMAAVAYGELLCLRPFGRANAVVGRGLLRHLLVRHGVDVSGAVVPEVAWAGGTAVHLSAAAGLATGRPDGVAAWVVHCAEAVVAGAREATEVADGVLAGRLPA